MKSFDAFGKPVKEFQVKTAFGGYLSVLSMVIMAVLFINELLYFLELDTKDVMRIDQNQDNKYLNISLDITFFEVPCAVLHLNLVDTKKLNVMHVAHDIYKQRFSKSGKPLGTRIRDSLRDVAETAFELAETTQRPPNERKLAHATAHLRCDSCYQSHIDEDDCCATCESVEKAFKERGIGQPTDYAFAQCSDDVYKRVLPQRGEYCRLQAELRVRKVAASIHMGVGRFFHGHHLAEGEGEARVELIHNLNFSHEIRSLSFGPDFPGLSRVLDGRRNSQHEPPNTEHFQYDVHVIPTTFQQAGGDDIVSHQYSVTEYVKSIDMKNRQDDLVSSGLFMSYDFTPFEVTVSQTRKKLTHFVTECCAIVGGVFAFTGMLDNFSYRLLKSGGNRHPRDSL